MIGVATPRPWAIDEERRHEIVFDPGGDGIPIAECFGLPDDGETEANAALIVHAVNAHDDLVAFAKAFVETYTADGICNTCGENSARWAAVAEEEQAAEVSGRARDMRVGADLSDAIEHDDGCLYVRARAALATAGVTS